MNTVNKLPTLKEGEITYNAQILLCKRYYSKLGDNLPTCRHCNNVHETHESFLTRVAGPRGTDIRTQIEAGKFLPNSPTLFNRGLNNGTLSACFVLEIQDSMLEDDGIMSIGRDAAAITKFGGGVGYYFGNLRPKGAPVNSTHGKACGPVEVMRYLHAVGRMITQSGKRAAAQMGVMPVEHNDILEFITCKDADPNDLNTFNISVSVSDDFMERVYNGDTHANYILDRMAQSCWTTGDPGVIFRDRVNQDNPTPDEGAILGCNPCSEQFLKHNESCNLASLNLMAFYDVETEVFDWVGMRFTVALMVRYLNQILDENIYPTEGIREASLRSRRIGVGFMGLGDLLAVMGIDYDRSTARTFASNIAYAIREQCERTTRYLATVDGPAPCFEGTGIMRRNAIVTSIQPTGTTAILLGVSTGIEPLFALENTRETADGDILTERPWSVDWLKSQGKDMPKVADAIAPEDHIRMVSVVQCHIDNGISKTVNLPNDATVDDIRDAMLMAWRLGCKAVSIFRDGCRDKQVLTKCGDEVCAPGQLPDEIKEFETESYGYVTTTVNVNGDSFEDLMLNSMQDLHRAGRLVDVEAEQAAKDEEIELAAATHHGFADVWWENEDKLIARQDAEKALQGVLAGGLDTFGIMLLGSIANKVLEASDSEYRYTLEPIK